MRAFCVPGSVLSTSKMSTYLIFMSCELGIVIVPVSQKRKLKPPAQAGPACWLPARSLVTSLSTLCRPVACPGSGPHSHAAEGSWPCHLPPPCWSQSFCIVLWHLKHQEGK